jgi:glycosyltransferase involved in cell wall biosynthesis
MNILFVHQNFPGQFKHLAPRLAAFGHRVLALTLRVKERKLWNGVEVLPYALPKTHRQSLHRWLVDLDTKVTRGEACYQAALALRESGFAPDIIIGHPGWGETMFLRDVWPEARVGLYYEFYYQAEPGISGFDPEFARPFPDDEPLRVRLKNLNNTLHLDVGDLGMSPTRFQADTYPEPFRRRISVIHDGIDTGRLTPDPGAEFPLPDGRRLTREDEVITFVNRNLEPYRGYHMFMRALPELLRALPNAHVLIVGGDGVSYGAAPPKGDGWKQIFIDEVRGQIADDDWARVQFLGRVPYDDFARLLQVSRVHVYLTYPFVLSWSLIEAMSAGAAIVASDTTPVREVISDGETGKLVDFFDREALVSTVSALLDAPEERAALGAAARALAVAEYDLEAISLPRQLDWVDKLAAMAPGRICG